MSKKIYMTESQFRRLVGHSLKENIALLQEEEEEQDYGIVTRDGVKVMPDGDALSDDTWDKVKKVLPVLTSATDDSVNSFNLTRSQIAYALWPTLDKDAARSKLSQKINGDKAWRESELNKIANIISGSIA